MTEKIKTALVQWATIIIKDQSNWDDEKTHDAIQKIYELSIFQKMLIDQEEIDQSLWETHQKKLDEVINSLTEDTNKEKIKDDNIEVAPMMETIKNMVTEMPEPETYEKLFETFETLWVVRAGKSFKDPPAGRRKFQARPGGSLKLETWI